MGNRALTLQAPANAQQAPCHDRFAILLEDFGPDNNVGHRALVFQGEKDDTARRAWALACNDEPGHTQPCAIGCCSEVLGWAEVRHVT